MVALVAGLAAGLGHAPFGLWPVALAGFVGLIWAVQGAARPERVAWVAGASYFALTLHWIIEPFLVDVERHGWMAPFALIFLAGGLALFWGLAGWLAGKIAAPRALGFVLTLTAAELLRGHIFTGFPWAMPAYIWADTPLRLSVAFVGSYGLTFLTLLAAGLPFALRNRPLGIGAGVAVLALAAAPGVLFSDPTDAQRSDLGQVRIIEPDIDQAEKWDPEKARGHFNRMLSLTRGPDGPTPDQALVIWPEVAVVNPLDVAQPVLSAIGATAGTPFITGINRRQDGNWHNSLVLGDADGSVLDVYDKVHLVPFGEYIPFRLGFLRQMAGTTSNGFTPGEAVRLIDTPIGRALPLICYEGIFPGHPFKAGERADYILILTNDAWFGTFAGPQQHFDQARFRAAEHRLPVVRVANKGVTAVIDPFGRVDSAQLAAIEDQNYIDAPVLKAAGVPLYARTGDWPLIAFLALTITAGLWLGRRQSLLKD
ncbi:MAG: apolipoprotein N-acyltransferase [Pseudomonadota bacterium]